jgi:Nucleotidyl transferase of unknown function (DUF2204)
VAEETQETQLQEALKTVAVTLKQSGVAFALAGGFAAWARGGPEDGHDVDFLVGASDVDQTKAHLEQQGLRTEQPPEDWLFKVFVGQAMVDLIHHLGDRPVDAGILDDADDLEVLSVRMPVLRVTQLLESQLRVLDEHNCDFATLLPTARALREQVDWQHVRENMTGNDYAEAFLFLLRRLGVAPD